MTLEQAVQKAKEVTLHQIGFSRSQGINQIEDDWFFISVDWDLNIWFDEEIGIHQATLYPVVNGHTQTCTFYPIDFKGEERRLL